MLWLKSLQKTVLPQPQPPPPALLCGFPSNYISPPFCPSRTPQFQLVFVLVCVIIPSLFFPSWSCSCHVISAAVCPLISAFVHVLISAAYFVYACWYYLLYILCCLLTVCYFYRVCYCLCLVVKVSAETVRRERMARWHSVL